MLNLFILIRETASQDFLLFKNSACCDNGLQNEHVRFLNMNSGNSLNFNNAAIIFLARSLNPKYDQSNEFIEFNCIWICFSFFNTNDFIV